MRRVATSFLAASFWVEWAHRLAAVPVRDPFGAIRLVVRAACSRPRRAFVHRNVWAWTGGDAFGLLGRPRMRVSELGRSVAVRWG